VGGARLDGPAVQPDAGNLPQSAVLALQLTASPAGDVIPGAVITLALSVTNEGGAAANGVHLTVPLPGGAKYRDG